MIRPAFLFSLCIVSLSLAADPPARPAGDPDGVRKTTAFEQERLRQQFSAFQQSLLGLAQRLEKSAKPEDREKALVLRQAIDLASREGIDTQFSKLVATLTASGVTLREIEGAIGQNEQLLKTLREMIQLLLSDNQSAKDKEEAKRLADMLKKLDTVIRSQKVERSKVESGKGDKDNLAKGQQKVTKDTKDLSKAFDPAKPSDPKSGDPKSGEPKKGEPKPGEPKDGKPKDGQPKDGQPKDGQPKDGDDKPGDQQQQPQSEMEQQRKQIQDAMENQKNAEERIKKDDRPGASNQQDEAIKKLEEVRKEIERRLKQLREEELQRMLANLENRCQRMLVLQQEVYDGTKRVFATIEQQPDKKPTRTEDLKAGELSAKEAVIVVEANKALQLIQEEGSAVAFPLVLEDVRDQMKVVQARLFRTDAGKFTQSIEEDIIATLKDMVASLKKAQQDMKDKQNQPPPPPGQPQPQKLIDMLADLKMIRTLQEQINKRTKSYAAEYPGEQADDPAIRKELHGLATRQEKVHKVTRDIATGKNVGQ
jgi:DNA repair exonuclease SbcCD ATPase subunit